jgi:hypothetical protein
MSGSLQNQLLALEDIITPQGVSLWPFAIGWWIFIIIICITVIFSIIFYRRYTKKWGYRREALALLKEYKKDSSDTDTAIKYLECLKRTAISAYPNKAIDSLYGRAWFNFLNQQTPKPLFESELENFICATQYQKTFNLKNDKLYIAIEAWIKQHSIHYSTKPYQSTEGGTI